MFRQTSTSNKRNRGYKIKHALQIAVLLAVCLWLLYQVKHSHDKKKAYDDHISKIGKSSSRDLGRKDLKDDMEVGPGDETHSGEEEDGKQGEADDDGRGVGDDEIDQRNQEKAEEGSEHGNGFVEEERENVEEKEDVKEGGHEEKENEEEKGNGEENEEEKKAEREKENGEENGEERKEEKEKVNGEKENEEKKKEDKIEDVGLTENRDPANGDGDSQEKKEDKEKENEEEKKEGREKENGEKENEEGRKEKEKEKEEERKEKEKEREEERKEKEKEKEEERKEKEEEKKEKEKENEEERREKEKEKEEERREKEDEKKEKEKENEEERKEKEEEKKEKEKENEEERKEKEKENEEEKKEKEKENEEERKEKENGEKENEEERKEKEKEKDEEKKEDKIEDVGSSENHDPANGDGSSQQAHEEHYIADNAANGVTQDPQIIGSGAGNGDSANPNEELRENLENTNLENENTNTTEKITVETNDSSQNPSEVPAGLGDGGTVDTPSNSTVNEEKDDRSSPNSEISGVNNQAEPHSNSILENIEASDSSPQNETSALELSQDWNLTNETELPNKDNMQSELLEHNEKTNAALGMEESDGNSVPLTSDEHVEAVQTEPTYSSNGLVIPEQKEALTDLATLPQAENEVKNTEVLAVE